MSGLGGMKRRSVSYEVVEADLSDGAMVFGDSSKYILFNSSMSPICSADAEPQVVHFPKSLLIPAGTTLTPTNRCKGLYVFVNGHLIIDGAISMSARGAAAVGVATPLHPIFRKIRKQIKTIVATQTISETYKDEYFGAIGTIPAEGAAGGATPGQSQYAGVGGNAGIAGTDRKCGGGGSGGLYSTNTRTAGAGGAGTSYSGGTGGGAVSGSNAPANGAPGDPNGGPGGNANGISYMSGGGAGNPGGAGAAGPAGGSGTGGVLFLVVRGSLFIRSGAVISADGVGGGNPTGSANSAGGGSSGGGSINIIYGGDYSNAGTIRANGGPGGSGPSGPGGAGGAGCITIEKVAGVWP